MMKTSPGLTSDLPVAASVVTLPSLGADPLTGAKVHHLGRGFRNLDPTYRYSLFDRAWRGLFRSVDGRPPAARALAALRNDGAALRANGTAPTVTWIGHATLLVQIQGFNVLTDPHWSERASPVDFAGPRRLVAPFARWALRRWPHGRPTLGQHARTTTVTGFLRVWMLTWLRPLRPVSWRASSCAPRAARLYRTRPTPRGAVATASSPAGTASTSKTTPGQRP